MQFGLKVNINGEEVTGRISNISTDVVDRVVGGDTGLRMKATRFVNKLGPVEEYNFPNGATYYNKDIIVNNKRIRKKGDILYKGRVLNISDKTGQELIGRLVN